ncbi:MAG: hypothetical protein M3N26_04635 [Pseudomonadota bacterium]|nr:hypothetical protein [Pseudomonadota bacterium]
MIFPTSAQTNYGASAGTSGSEGAGPSGGWPEALDVSREDLMHGLNPLQHVPIVGMIYRAATGETLPTTMRVAGAGLIGGPLGMIGAGLMSIFEAIIKMGPDSSRPAAPAGMAQTGSEAGVEPVTPGSMTGNSYVTLATTTPDFLLSPGSGGVSDLPNTAIVQNGTAAYQSASLEWMRSQSVEKGLA